MSAALLIFRRVPSIAWVILFVVASLLAAGVGIYRHAEQNGEAKVYRVALQDSTTQQIAAVDQAAKASDSIGVIAAKAVRSSTTGRVHARDVLEAAKDTIPPTVLSEISAQFDRDSTTIAVLVAKSESDDIERLSRIQLDTLREHAENFKPPGSALSTRDVLIDVGIVAIAIESVRLLLQLLHR